MPLPVLRIAVPVLAISLLGVYSSSVLAQAHPSSLLETGHLSVAGRELPYQIRNLPVSSFPNLPQPVADALTARGCVVPQTYRAHHPENVVHASLERPASSDWAVLCGVKGLYG